MKEETYEIEPTKPFSESLIWQLNRDFYQQAGISAWSDEVVPHNMTSNSMVGKTYAELILAFLKDRAKKGKTIERVYILELGAGHGRLAFHILKHLEGLVLSLDIEIPPYCYILSDIVEDNLSFFHAHPQFQAYFKQGTLDLAYFDGVKSQELHLRDSDITIRPQELNQPILAIANYFFDSIPNDLFFIKDNKIAACSVSLHSRVDPSNNDIATLIKSIVPTYHQQPLTKPFYSTAIFNEILEEYRNLVTGTYLFFPQKGMQCLTNIKNFSSEGLLLLTMDKGFHEIQDLKKKKEPEIVTHGSLSFWVNYHAYGTFCEKQGGKAFFPAFSTFQLEMGCLLFLPDSETYVQTASVYQRVIDDFGPDDLTSIKKIAYFNVSKLKLKELIALIRLSAYDSTFFIKLLPRLKKVIQAVTFSERNRIAQTLHQVWKIYFNINEKYDLAYELGGIFYDLGFYQEALNYFQYSTNLFGQKADSYYNKALCHYQLRQDKLFHKTVKKAKEAYPGNARFDHLDKLDMTAA